MKEMKFSEAVEKMNPGDIFDPGPCSFSKFIMNENGTFKGYECDNPSELPLSKTHLNLIGKIIPAEPVVLSAERLFDKCSDLIGEDDFEYIHEIIDKNSQLKRDLDYKELRMKVENLLNTVGADYDCIEIQELSNTYENLKPLD